MPAVPKLSSPGRALASAINSFSDFTGIDGCTDSICGMVAISVIAAKSRCGSNGSFAYSDADTAFVVFVPSSSV